MPDEALSKILNFPVISREVAEDFTAGHAADDDAIEDFLMKIAGSTRRALHDTGTDTLSNMSTPTREELSGRLEAIEARMDARVAKIEGRIETFIAQADEREKRLTLLLEEREKRQEERDKRIEMLANSADKAAERAGALKGHFWGAAVSIILSVGGIAIASYFATQSSNIMIAQTTLAAFQAGQQAPTSQSKPTNDSASPATKK